MLLKKTFASFVLGILIIIALSVFWVVKTHDLEIDVNKISEPLALKEGRVKMLGGVVTGIDIKQGKIMIHQTSIEESKYYLIKVKKDTQFIFLTYIREDASYQIINGWPVYENGLLKITTRESPVSFQDFKIGDKVQVYFEERIDLEKEKNLYAQKISVVNFQE